MGVIFHSIVFLFFSGFSYCQSPANFIDDPANIIFILAVIALIPFLAVLTTSFAKTVIVLSITRQALGTPQAPPNIVIISLAIILTCFAMYPVFAQIYANFDNSLITSANNQELLKHILQICEEPIKNYLSSKSQPDNINLFLEIVQEKNLNNTQQILPTDFIILAPAFLISELTQAFQIGFLIYLPFLVIDMTIANLLMALGMQMLAPTTISLPFKILLFVLIDGWHMLAKNIVGN